ncbi:MAG: tetratricopeptide repeat protein [Desulfuromonadales bacterium]|nr:tetratricopeptide repeat protein [Desulfuromonadales bacterium]
MTNKPPSRGKIPIDEMFQRASLCVDNGDFSGAQALYREILTRHPENTRALHSLGVVMYRGGGNSEEALQLIRQAIELKPDYPDARCNLGNMLNELRRFSEAEECYKAALAINPDLSLALVGLGNVFFKKQLFEDALYYYKKATELSPDAAIYVQTGAALNKMGHNEDAASAYRSALAIKDDCGEAYYGLASVYEAGANLIAASEYAQQALKLMPSSSTAMQVMAVIYLASGRADEALVWFQRAVDAGGGGLAFSNMLFAMNYSQNCLPDEIFKESCRWENVAAVHQEHFTFPPRSPGRLRIGYVSGDFKQHSVAFFFEPLLTAHNRNRFEVHCYSNVVVSDKITDRLKEHAEYWHDIRRLSDREAIDRIREDRIDILIDLAGHTADSRLGIFARRAAPVQMTWLGYPNTTGVSAIDYRFTDAVADPEGESDSQHSERLIRLPDCFLCYQPPEDAPDVAPPPSLLNGFITFGSFNNPAKITPEVVELWSRILLAVPNSRLLLKSKSFCDPELAKIFSESFVVYGLSAERIMCVPATETISNHLAIYSQIDIALDSFPYNGTTTTFESLFMGVPVIVLRGNRHAGRVGASILTNLGVPELIANTVDDYLAASVSLSRDIHRLSAYHTNLRNQLTASTLVDASRFADSIEDAYRSVWQTYIPVHPVSLHNLEDHFLQARKHFMQFEYVQARSIFEAILAAHPDDPRALHGMGIICYRLGDSESAIRNVFRAVQLNTNYPGALSSLGNIYKETGRLREAIDYFRQARDLDPCNCEFHSNILMSMQYLPGYSRDEIFKEAKLWSDYHARRPFQDHSNGNNVVNISGKIRIGFVSANFNKHPVGFIIIPFLAAYDRERFELFCYSNNTKSDEVTEQLISLVDVWRMIDGMPDRVAWQMIHDDAIDILVDLSGHTAGNRLVLFSMRPAPIQVSWLGYFDTTGLDSIDYLITDSFITPTGEERWFTEKFAYLPDSRFCYAPPEYAPAIGAPPACANGFITFGSFNNIAKLTEDVIALWAAILQQLKDSRLIIKWKSSHDNAVITHYLELFRKYGVDPVGRVEFRGESGHQEMLRQYGEVDIALDPFPFSGGLTSLESLWMGVPIITLKGDRLVSRQTASFLEILKHDELVADSVEQYRVCAVNLAGDVERLSTLRRSLREEMCRSPLCNAAAFAHNISNVFKRIVLRHVSLLEPTVVLSEELEGELDRRCNEAAQLVEAGKMDEAEACYEAVLVNVKKYPRAMHALGVVRYRRGDFENGIELVRNSIDIKPDYVDALLNLGKMLHEQGCFLEASDCYRKIVDIRPDDQNSLYLMGMLLSKAGESEKSIIAYLSLIAIAPEHFDAIFNLGQILLGVRRFDEAEKLLQRACSLAPDNVGVLIALGNLALNQRDFAGAEKYYLNACKIDPESAEAHANLGHLYTDQNIEEAIRHCRIAVELKPDLVLAWVNLGVALSRGRQNFEAISAYREALELDADLSDIHSSLIMLINYMPEYSQHKIFAESIAWNDCYGTGFDELWKNRIYSPCIGRKIRIGFVSADFKLHPVSYHFLPVVENYDKSAFEFICYSNTDVFDELSVHIKGSVDLWRDIYTLSDDQAAELVCQDRIDILVDLSGHTAGNRLLLFARKPAPIQVSWLGYFNTTGLSVIDYLISDAITIPIDEESYFSEKVLRLPSTRFCYAPPPEAPSVDVTVAERSGGVTFASFNNSAKISLECIDLWSAVLVAMPDSRLILKWESYKDEGLRSHIVRAFEKHYIGPERLEFRGMSPRGDMLAQYSDVDICLDTYPFCGGATTCDALWMGVPVVTLTGQTPISRQSASFLACIGHPELIADSPDSYLCIVKDLASDAVHRAVLRRTLRADMSLSLLCDGVSFTRNLEVLFRQMIVEKQARFVSHSESVPDDRNDVLYQGLDLLASKDFVNAAESFERVVTLYPDNADAHNNLGIAYFEIGFRDDAKEEFKSATKIAPNHVEAWKNLGKAIRDTGGNPELSARCFRKALSIDPDFDDAWMMLGTTLLDRGRSVEAVKCFRKTLELNPTNCDAHSNLLFAMNYLPQITQTDIYQESLKWNDIHAVGITQVQHSSLSSSHPNHLPEGEGTKCSKLRIGYVSGDFKRHPVGYHLLPVIAAHDREQFEVYCYATMNGQDDLTEKIQGYVTGWHDITRLSDNDAAALICGDRIDILVDLSGHTGGNRLLLFASKPAPVQVSWLGYFNTTGVKTIDYLISDETTIPLEDEQWFSEKIIRLPGSRFCYAPPEYAPPVASPPAMTNNFITFGSFNNIAKVTPEVIALWSRVLIAVPDSRLIIKWSTLGRKKVRDRLLCQFARHGVTSERIVLRGKSPHVDMLKEYGDIDIALDPFPFSGGMTSCEALWMGVPVLTLLGNKPAGRQTSGFLRTIGLPEWVTISVEQFLSRAQEVASEYEKLKSIRFELRKRMIASTLCDGVSFTSHLEARFRSMWQTWVTNQSEVFLQMAQEMILAHRYTEAEDFCERAVDVIPCNPKAYCLMGDANKFLLRFEDAEACYQLAYQMQPENPLYLFNVAMLQRDRGIFLQAIETFMLVLASHPDHAESLSALGYCLMYLGRYYEAANYCSQAVELCPASAEYIVNLGAVLFYSGEAEKATVLFQRAMNVDPGYSRALSSFLFIMNYHQGMSQAELFEKTKKWDHLYGERFTKICHIPERLLDNGKILNIGFVSPDFGRHPIGFFLQHPFEFHDRARFKYFCYSDRLSEDDVTTRLRENSDEWRVTLYMDDHSLSRQIQADEIDILVDLTGHAAKNRLCLFSMKPAPVQVTWAGYAGTTGLSAMDWLLSDHFESPIGAELYCSEQIYRMPRDYISYRPPDYAPFVSVLPATINGFVTFGCFNNLVKINQAVLQLWGEILKSVPSSKLFVKTRELNDPDRKQRFLDSCITAGISADVLILEGGSPHAELLAAYQRVDIALDPFPYSGGLTTLESLWMGVPVVTLTGNRFCSRHSLTHLSNVNLSYLAAETPEEYVELSCRLAVDIQKLENLRLALRSKMAISAICNGSKFAENLDYAFRFIWKNRCGTYLDE